MKRKIVVLVGVALALLIGAAVFTNNRQRQQMDREVTAILAAAKAAGQPTTTEELARWRRRNIPNGAVSTVIERAVNALPRDIPKVDIFSGLSPLPAHKVYETALDAPLRETQVPSLEAFVATNAAFFQTIEAITNSGEAVFNLQWAEGHRMLVAHLSPLKKSAEALATRCHLRIDRGDVSNALRDIDLVYRLSSSLADEPTLISQSVRMSIASIGQQLVNRLLCHMELTEPELQLLARSVDQEPLNSVVATGLIGERVFGLEAFNNPPPMVSLPAYGSAAWKHDRWLYLKSTTAQLNAANGPPPENLEKVAVVEAEQVVARAPKPSMFWPIDMVRNYRKRTEDTSLIISGLSGVMAKAAETLTAHRIARAAIAVELYRLEHERLPSMLSDVARFTSPDGLIDPFTGKQLIYKTNSVGSAYVIYGVGKDRKDDGGHNLNPEERKPAAVTKDVIFPVTLKRRQR